MDVHSVDVDDAPEVSEEGQQGESVGDSGESDVQDTDQGALETEEEQAYRLLVEGVARNLARQDERIVRLSDSMDEYRVHVAEQLEHSFVEAASTLAVRHEQVLAAMHEVAKRTEGMIRTVRDDQHTMNESGIELARRVLEIGQAVAHLVARPAFDAAGGTPAAAATPTAPTTPDEQEESKPTTPSSDWTKIMAGLGLPHSTDKKGKKGKKDKMDKARKPKDKRKASIPVGAAGAGGGDDSSSDHTDSSSEQGSVGRAGAGRRDSDLPKHSSSEKRQTMFSRRTHQAALNKDKLLYTATQPPTAHLYLRRLSLHSVWKFLNDTSEYMEKYGLEVLGATLIDPTIVEKLRADYSKLSKEKFFQLDNDSLYKVLQSKVKPLSILEFYKLMDSNVIPPVLHSRLSFGLCAKLGPIRAARFGGKGSRVVSSPKARRPKPPPEPVVVLVTGSSTGIGKSTVMQFASDTRFKVYASMRRVEVWDQPEAENVVVVQMDVTSDSSVGALVARIIESEGKIDVVVNNAGYGMAGCLEVVTIEEAQKVFEVIGRGG
ncbi:hypothetical protein B484DRAFT_397280 [Ochromonadaceae sp. CCMP2298]|nr:hypothetical protein B484DRAFT_397280 [Ochromonadaceae sp. CCMP2298]